MPKTTTKQSRTRSIGSWKPGSSCTNASYFAFTATPKNKTLEIFGEPHREEGQVKHRPFHSYSMKQAIQEGFILDVLRTTRLSTAITGWSRLSRVIPSST